MIQIELKPEIEARLVADAHAEGVEPAVYAGSMIERVYIRVNGTSMAPADHHGSRRKFARGSIP